MDFSPVARGRNSVATVKQIISKFIRENSRLARTSMPGHLELLGKELGVREILIRPMSGIQDQHPGIDAMLVPLSDGYSVVINEQAQNTRRNFSLAHELAHIMVLEAESSAEGLTKVPRYRSSASATDKWKAEERLCDAIAAELLMPEEIFSAQMREVGQSLEHLPRLANMFGASLTATTLRYWELIPEPCYLIRWWSVSLRRDIIRPTWQKRNKSPGPYICPITASSITKRNEFRNLRETWRTMRTSVTQECLLARHKSAGRRYVSPVTFETESMGFGSQENRTIVSAVYLDRISENA